MFLPAEVAEMIANNPDQTFTTQRKEIVVLFCDLRGFTDFSGRKEPEEVMQVIQSYHQQLGKLISEHKGTLSHRAGDGLMVIFNDLTQHSNPQEKALQLALAMRKLMEQLTRHWNKHQHELGFGIGIASGFATLGVVGFEGRYDYTAIGNVVNLSARLCDQAKDQQILLDHHVFVACDTKHKFEPVNDLKMKGVDKDISVYST